MIKVGQEVIIQGYGNYAKVLVVKALVSKVGKTYFYVNHRYQDYPFKLVPEKEGYHYDKETNRGPSHSFIAWTSEETKNLYDTRCLMQKTIEQKFRYGTIVHSLSDDQLKRIVEIIEENNVNE